ncbi:MAG: lipocalin-like domain-containing protein [Bacteroidales bacterium]|nr:lipocalin-like domain-containing protein [Bacteroidales bacterium]
MKRMKYFPLVAGSLLAVTLLSNCEAEGANEAGDLYGRWKLESVKATAPVAHSDTLYLAFQGKVYQYQPNWDYDWGTYRHTADSLILNPLQYEKYFFKEMGITLGHPRESAAFKIDELSKKRMQISRHDTIWYFKKYIE